MFFALIPLLALVIGALGFLYGPDRAAVQFGAILREIYPSARDAETGIVRQLVDGRAISLGLGVVGTIFSATAVFGTIDSALAAVLGREGKRAFVRGKLAGLGFILALAALAIVSFAGSLFAQAADAVLASAPQSVTVLVSLLSQTLALVPGAAFFFAIYRLVPRRRVPTETALRAAVVSAVLWEIAKVGFGALARRLGIFQAYGPLALAAGLLTWIYLTAAIVLIGAELIKTERRARA